MDTLDEAIMLGRYHDARVRAKARSGMNCSTVYVNAVVSVVDGRPTITEYHMSDFMEYCGTIAAFSCGRELDLADF